jgi:hypothetical protein
MRSYTLLIRDIREYRFYKKAIGRSWVPIINIFYTIKNNNI